MVKIITDYGYCYGVESAIAKMKKASSSFSKLYLTHPLIHNTEENEALMKEANASFLEKEVPYCEKNGILLSAHGHSLEEEKEAEKHGKILDATCPLIVSRYQRIPKEESDISFLYLGKAKHQETIGFLSHFPYFTLLSSEKDLLPQLSALSLKKKSVFVPQTTVSEEAYNKVLTYLKDRSEVVFTLPICPIYGRRTQQALEALKDVDPLKSYFLVCGDKSSSNANEIASAIQKAYPLLKVAIVLKADSTLKQETAGRDIYIGSATSVNRETVEALAKSLS